MIPATLYENGFTELVCVAPPNAQLSPRSRIAAGSLGKAPAVRYRNGTWGGYDWLKHPPTLEEVREWELWGANVGILAEQYPAVDIDVLDPELAEILEDVVTDVLGNAPRRIGRAPKRLLMYRLEGAPFGRMAVKLTNGRAEYLLEVLGAGRQYLLTGMHPSGQPYRWELPADFALEQLRPEHLVPLSQEQVERLFARLAEDLPVLGWDVVRLGDEKTRDRVAQDAALLQAPSAEALEEAVLRLPNTDALFPERSDYIKVAYAIRAAASGLLEDEGEYLFADWAARWDNPAGNDPETVRSDWRRVAGPYSVGYPWLAELAAKHGGFNPAPHEFTALPDDAHASEVVPPPRGSDRDLAEEVYLEYGTRIRFMPGARHWLVWDGARWARDAVAQAEHLVGMTLNRLADRALRSGGSVTEMAKGKVEAARLCSATCRENVMKFVKTDPRITVAPEHFDTDRWLLNTPGGTVDLRTGVLTPHDSAALLTKQTAVTPSAEQRPTEWFRFLAEATGDDGELQSYLQRVAGYCLTGATREQVLFFLWGPGGNGKSVFVNALIHVFGDYARQAPMDMFTTGYGDRHPTDIASLQGARLVAASETQAGRRWDEARMKSLTGGERVSARFMRGDFFQYDPQFKLLFVGNHKPEIRDIDDAMRRRIQLVPFTVTPKVVDQLLPQKLEAEYPAILAWAIAGCLAWQSGGLAVPPSVAASTKDYFAAEDGVGRWLAECCELGEYETTTEQLFSSWREWTNRSGEYTGSIKRLSQLLINRRFGRWTQPETGRAGFRGLRILQDERLP